jgi:hypothetical protein
MNRYLTKSKFQLAMECPAKLYYIDKSEYANQKPEDPFLEALAEGGFQVGELAKHYFPGGIRVDAQEVEEAARKTSELLRQDRVIIFEGVTAYGNLLARHDILIKNGESIKLIEVKSKSFDSDEGPDFANCWGEITTEWQPYLYDVAFQKHVLCAAFPDFDLSGHLMLADRSAFCPTDGLNQKFKISKDAEARNTVVTSSGLSAEDLDPPILSEVNVDGFCDSIFAQRVAYGEMEFSFGEYVEFLAENHSKDRKISAAASKICGCCEFKATEEDRGIGLKCGFRECWKENFNWTDDDFKYPTVLEIWNFRRKDSFIGEGRIKLSQITEADIMPHRDGKAGLSTSERQWLQVSKAQRNDDSYWIDAENLKLEMDSWTYPLHFIDFETSMVAIPFNKGRRPYEGIAFQFSHHLVHEDGRAEHRGQHLSSAPGFFPNYEFVRKLKCELDKDSGTIFRYAAHENSYLNLIYSQLREEDQETVNDREELCEFIRSITKSRNGSCEIWEGERCMVDMLELVKRYYYDPAMKGSNSLKVVLPSVIRNSTFLKDKYSRPNYGSGDGIKSLNFADKRWIETDMLDPYKLLPKMFQDIPEDVCDMLIGTDEIREGGAAMIAYAKLQFEEMSEYERSEIKKALLRYCELDTLAMVMLHEGLRDLAGIGKE